MTTAPDEEEGTEKDSAADRDEQDDTPLTPEQRALVQTAEGLAESRVAYHVARAPKAVHLSDDLVSAAKRRLTEAARRYSPKFGATFRTYARYSIDGAILDEIAREARQADLRIAGAMCLRLGALSHPSAREDTLDAMVDDETAADTKLRRSLRARAVGAALAFAMQLEELVDDQVDPEHAAAVRKLGDALKTVLRTLPPRDQEMLRCLYAGGMDLGAVAERFGLAYPTVKTRHAKILGQLREALSVLGFSSSSGAE